MFCVPHLQIAPGDRIVDIYETLRQHGLESTGSKLSAQYKYKFTLEAEISHVRITHTASPLKSAKIKRRVGKA